jgi:hypothetical protein
MGSGGNPATVFCNDMSDCVEEPGATQQAVFNECKSLCDTCSSADTAMIHELGSYGGACSALRNAVRDAGTAVSPACADNLNSSLDFALDSGTWQQ